MFWKKIVISDPLLYHRPLLLRQLKNNQNQTNTTGALNFKELIIQLGGNFMFFMEGTQKKIKLSRKVITHPSFASFFACEIKND
jgi:hypothetical protein